jgi:hypothetical protein
MNHCVEFSQGGFILRAGRLQIAEEPDALVLIAIAQKNFECLQEAKYRGTNLANTISRVLRFTTYNPRPATLPKSISTLHLEKSS